MNITAVLAGGGGGDDGGGSGWVAAGGDFSDVAVWSLSDATLAALGEEGALHVHRCMCTAACAPHVHYRCSCGVERRAPG